MAENKRNTVGRGQPRKRLALRLVAGALAVVMLLSGVLLYATRIVARKDSGVSETAANRAFQTLAENDAYFSADAVTRVEMFLALLGKELDTPERCRQLAAIYAGRGEYAEAAVLFSDAIEQTAPGETEALAELQLQYGSALVLSGALERAKDAFMEAVALAPDATLPRLMLAETAVEMQDYALAAEQMQAYLSLEPGDYENRRILANLYLSTEQYAAAYREYLAVHVLSQSDDDRLAAANAALLSGDRKNGIDLLTRYLEQNDDANGALHYLRGIAYLWEERYGDAKTDLLASLAAGYEPQADAYKNLTICTYMTGDYDATLTYGERAAASWSAPDGECLQRMGLAALQLGDPEGAASFLLESRAADASLTDNDYFLATAFLMLQDYDKAADAYAAAIQSGVRLQECYYNRAVCLMQLGRYIEAQSDLTKCLSAGDDEELLTAARAFLNQLGVPIENP